MNLNLNLSYTSVFVTVNMVYRWNSI